jgi:hypothetical protein
LTGRRGTCRGRFKTPTLRSAEQRNTCMIAPAGSARRGAALDLRLRISSEKHCRRSLSIAVVNQARRLKQPRTESGVIKSGSACFHAFGSIVVIPVARTPSGRGKRCYGTGKRAFHHRLPTIVEPEFAEPLPFSGKLRACSQRTSLALIGRNRGFVAGAIDFYVRQRCARYSPPTISLRICKWSGPSLRRFRWADREIRVTATSFLVCSPVLL